MTFRNPLPGLGGSVRAAWHGLRNAARELRSGPRGRRGTVSLMVGVTMPALVGFTALGVDAANLYRHRRMLQATADMAALAGSALLPNTANAVTTAVSYATKNMPTAKYGNVLTAADVSTGTWNPTTRVFTAGGTNQSAVRVTVRSTSARGNPFGLTFAGIFGFRTADLTATATATFGTYQPWDISIIQDVTASLSSSQMTNAKNADRAMLDCVKNNFGAQSQVSILSFTGINQTKIGMTSVTTTTNYNSLTNAINSMNICGNSGQPACSGTNIAAGIQLGLSKFTTGYTPAVNGYGKALIIVSDGEPNWTRSSTTNNGLYGPTMGGTCTGCTNQTNGDAGLRANAIAQADAAAAAGLSIFTVYLDQSNGTNTAARDFLASLVRGNGQAYSSTQSNQLSNLMFNICATVPRRLVD